MILLQTKFGLNFQLPSINFLQCQNVLRSVLKSSSSETIKSLWKSSSCGTNIQYDIYLNTKQALKMVQQEHTYRLTNQLISQGFIVSFLLSHSLAALNSLRSSTQSKLPKNIFNFTIRYLNDTLATRNNLQRRNLSQSSDCSFCLREQSLFMTGVGAEEKLLCALKKILPHHLLRSNFLYPTKGRLGKNSPHLFSRIVHVMVFK